MQPRYTDAGQATVRLEDEAGSVRFVPAGHPLLDGLTIAAAQPLTPAAISRRQFFHALYRHEPPLVSFAEAKAAIAGSTIPVALAMVIDALPEAFDREDVELLVLGATEFRRDHPVTTAMATAFGWAGASTDAFWRFAATL